MKAKQGHCLTGHTLSSCLSFEVLLDYNYFSVQFLLFQCSDCELHCGFFTETIKALEPPQVLSSIGKLFNI